MKKVVIILSLLFVSRIISAQNNQTFEISSASIAQAIIDLSDSLQISYPFHVFNTFRFECNIQQIIYSPTERSMHLITFPCIQDEATARSVFNVIDSLAKTGVYTNLLIVNAIARHFAFIADGGADWQKEIALKAVKLDLDYSAQASNRSPAVSSVTSLVK